MTNSTVQKKVDRLRKGGKPRVLDLFAGCGGISLGFQRAGFCIQAAIEFDPLAALSHAKNFYPNEVDAHFQRHAQQRHL